MVHGRTVERVTNSSSLSQIFMPCLLDVDQSYDEQFGGALIKSSYIDLAISARDGNFFGDVQIGRLYGTRLRCLHSFTK